VSSPHSALLSPPWGEPYIKVPRYRFSLRSIFEHPLSRFEVMVKLTFRATCTVLLLLIIYTGPASSEAPEGTWLLANRVAIQVFECSGLLCGKIVWLVRPRTPAGQPDVDRLNPDPALRQRPLCGLTIIWGLQPDSPGHWSNGWLYDPQDGNTYDLTAELTAPDRISARVYRGVPLFGRTEILIRDPELSSDGRC
jgi:uncharacterized protein (DUF2147 family)